MSNTRPNNPTNGFIGPVILDEPLADVRGAERHFVLTMTDGLYNVSYIKTILTDGRTALEPIPNDSGMTFIDFVNYANAYIVPIGLRPVIDCNLSQGQLLRMLVKCQILKIKVQERS